MPWDLDCADRDFRILERKEPMLCLDPRARREIVLDIAQQPRATRDRILANVAPDLAAEVRAHVKRYGEPNTAVRDPRWGAKG